MEQFETGMVARSQSGHDAGKVYVITKVEEAYVYLVDGKVRTLDKPKKKKKKHVQLIKESFDIQGATDVDIKRWTKFGIRKIIRIRRKRICQRLT